MDLEVVDMIEAGATGGGSALGIAAGTPLGPFGQAVGGAIGGNLAHQAFNDPLGALETAVNPVGALEQLPVVGDAIGAVKGVPVVGDVVSVATNPIGAAINVTKKIFGF